MSSTEELIARCQSGDVVAKEQLVTQNVGLIWSVARRFLGRGTEADDLYQIGCVGFLKAIDGFDSSFGTQFSTYAVPKISGEIRRFLRDDGAVKISRTIKERAASIKKAQSELVNRNGREPTISELCDYTGYAIDEIVTAEQATSFVESIQQENGQDGFSLENILSDTDSEDEILEKMALREAVNKLPERESIVIKLRYYHGLTQDKISKILSVSQVQVSRIEKKALDRLNDYLR